MLNVDFHKFNQGENLEPGRTVESLEPIEDEEETASELPERDEYDDKAQDHD